MLRIEDALPRLFTLRDDYTRVALLKPAGNTSFDYGHACGKAAGIELSIQAITQTIEEAAATEKKSL